MPKTLFQKIWDKHVVTEQDGAPAVLYIDLHLVQRIGEVPTNQVLWAQPETSLLINDRYSDSPALLVALPAAGERHFLVRVKGNLTRRLLEVFPDGSALVEIGAGQKRRVVREIVGRVQRGGGWTSRRCGCGPVCWTGAATRRGSCWRCMAGAGSRRSSTRS